jgi:ligand-binding sensor domain-containing protein/signal transduction histidine kinase
MPSLFRWLASGFTLVCWVGEVRALDPNHALSQYLREQWTTDRNFPGGAIDSITQTSDGYLWMGTANGLVRFDGVNFHLTSSFSEFSGEPVSGLTTDSAGRLCVIFWGAGVLCDRGGKFVNLASTLRRTTLEGISSWRKEDGALVLTDLMDGILQVQGENVQVLAPRILLPPSLVLALAETRDGKLWFGTAAGLFYFAEGRTTRAKGVSDKKINCLLPVGDRELWVGTSKGLYQWNGSLLSRVKLPQALADVQVLALVRDHDGNVWAGTTRGLLRINASGVSVNDEGSFESGAINALFEDREGNLWAGGGRGLERIRDGTFVTYAPAAGSSSKQDGPIYVDSANRTWFAPAGGGLYVMKDGHAHALQSSFVHDDVVYSITGRKNEIWLGTQRSGLKRFEYANEVTGAKAYTQENGLAENGVFAVYQSQGGAVWAGTLTGGVSKFIDGKFVTYTAADGLASNSVSAVLDTREGTVWFATPNGLSAFSRRRWKTYRTEDGLPSNSVNCLFEDSAGVLWIGTSRGLAFFKSGRVQIPRDTPDSLREETFGMSEDKEGWLWIATSDHVLRVSNQKLSSGGVLSSAEVCEYGAADGLPNARGVKRNRSVVADSQGRIWFSTSRGLSVVDPSHIMNNSAPALPHVEAILADNDPITVGDLVRIPSFRKRITFRYSGLSLAVPERVRFRYSLDSFDRGWSEPTTDREAVYTNLSPGSYRFRVIASNSYGQWNDSEAAVSLEVDPAYYQTISFRSLCVAVFLALLATLYRLRLRQVARQFNMRLEERVSERTRIARELHDTLLQSFHGLLPRFQAAHNLLPGRAVDARQVLEAALDDAAQAVTEARDAVQDLRSSTTDTNDLAKAIEALGGELSAFQTSANGAATDFSVQVNGTPQDLHPILRDEIYRITGEALRNAFHHARARRIEVEIEYGTRQVRTRVRDDGSGIDAVVLSEEGRPGHFGLRGMRERSKRIGGQLDVWSERGAGTEVELTIPASIAYGGHAGPRMRGFKSKAEKTL